MRESKTEESAAPLLAAKGGASAAGFAGGGGDIDRCLGRLHRILARKRVLIAEDDGLSRKLLRDMLAVHGYGVIEATDGRQAQELARRHRPDLILLDIRLPRISGLDVARWIKADAGLRHIPVIAVTALVGAADQERIRLAGCDHFVAKPVSVAPLIKIIAHCAGRTGAVAA